MPDIKERDPIFTTPIAEYIWETRVRLAQAGAVTDPTIRASWERIALALSKPDLHHRDQWRQRYEALLRHFRFIPELQTMYAAGSDRRIALFDCMALEMPGDSIDSLFNVLREAMLTLQEGCAFGCDFSNLRPAGMAAAATGNRATGPVSFLNLWEQASATLLADGAQPRQMTATLRCDHPDILQFIDAKRGQTDSQHFKLQVLITNEFMQAVDEDGPWQLVFPLADRPVPEGALVCERTWYSVVSAEPCLVMATLPARQLWRQLLQAAYDCGQPGVIFVDRIQQANNLWYLEQDHATILSNETPLPPNGTCSSGSINLTQFVEDPFGRHARLDLAAVSAATSVAVRMLDNVYDCSHFPLKAQKKAALASRRIGVGITGLADTFVMLGLRYGSAAATEIADAAMQAVCHSAYRSAIELAQQRGSFPAYRSAEYMASDFILGLPRNIADAIGESGIRNSHLTALAPSSALSMLANHVSNGIQPIARFQSEQQVRGKDGQWMPLRIDDYAWSLFRRLHGNSKLPNSFVEAADIDPADQIKLQAVLHAYVDNAIDKHIISRHDLGFDAFCQLYQQAYSAGLKGCAVIRMAS